jgi:hypothetical protein
MSIEKGINMELRDLLARAQQEVDAAGVAEDLRQTAFSKAFEFLSSGAGAGPNAGGDASSQPARQGIEAIAERLRVEPSVAAEVFDVADDRIEIVLAPSRLPRQRAAAMRDVALLLVCARQASGLDDGWTPIGAVREQCREIGVLDTGNFSTEVGSMGDVFSFRGAGRARLLRATGRGYERAGLRIQELTAPSA